VVPRWTDCTENQVDGSARAERRKEIESLPRSEMARWRYEFAKPSEYLFNLLGIVSRDDDCCLYSIFPPVAAASYHL
jgi:hypothetical protein